MRLVYADALLDAIEDKEWVHITDYNIALYTVKDAPTVDAVPVRHGRWKCSDDSFETAVCSVCNHDTNEPFEWLIGQNDSFQFCPHCGAKMDGEGNGDEQTQKVE